MRVLVVEDDAKLAEVLRRGLTREGYVIDVATSGVDALWAARELPLDLIVLDVGIPPPDGIEVCRQVRAAGVWTPVILLTARDSLADRVEGLDAGADDYLPKPFALTELYARLRALLRRGAVERPVELVAGDLRLDPASRQVMRGDEPIQLTAREFCVLELLLRRAGDVVSRTELRDHAWDSAYEGTSNVVDVYVRYLREKIDRPFGRHSLETVRGAGYRLRVDGG